MSDYYKVVAENRKAFHDYNIIEDYRAGLVLAGQEVKSLRVGRINLKDSFGRVESGEIWVYNMHISPYERASKSIDPYRKRKLLLSRQELRKIISKAAEKGLVMVPLKVYFSGDWVKLDLGLGKPKKTFEKKEKLIKKDTDKYIAGVLKGKR